jgi:acetoacetyl-CoA synthetase
MPLPTPQILRYTSWLARERGLHFDPTTVDGYDALWRWSVDDLGVFWGTIWDYFGVESPTPIDAVLQSPGMPGARWFAGAQLNYAQQVFRHADAAHAGAIRQSCSRTSRCKRAEPSGN